MKTYLKNQHFNLYHQCSQNHSQISYQNTKLSKHNFYTFEHIETSLAYTIFKLTLAQYLTKHTILFA